MIPSSNGNHPTPARAGSAVYVDTENLRDNDRAQDVIARVVAGWPGGCPPVASLSLYVRADKVALWRIWAEATYPMLRVRVRGVQHFSNSKAKNSADLAITADAVADLVTGDAATVAVISNDSDFGALFVKVRELVDVAAVAPAPFLWITAPDAGGLSPEMERFVPAQYRWDLSDDDTAPAPAAVIPTTSKPAIESLPDAIHPARLAALATPAAPTTTAAPTAPAVRDANPGGDAIAEELIRRLPIGKFKVADAQSVIRGRWPKMAVAGDTAQLGQHLLKEVWPMLEKRGVTMPRKSSPRTYEITQAAKDSIAPPPTARPAVQSKGKTAAEPTPAQLAAAVAAGISDDIFSASEAQAVIKARWPEHPASNDIPQRFGVWFKNGLWPVMENHNVTIAKEKPRRYEMPPDARNRLIAQAEQ